MSDENTHDVMRSFSLTFSRLRNGTYRVKSEGIDPTRGHPIDDVIYHDVHTLQREASGLIAEVINKREPSDG